MIELPMNCFGCLDSGYSASICRECSHYQEKVKNENKARRDKDQEIYDLKREVASLKKQLSEALKGLSYGRVQFR